MIMIYTQVIPAQALGRAPPGTLILLLNTHCSYMNKITNVAL